MQDEQLYIPYENFVYIGDSATDIPCMRLVKSKGGYSIGVYDPEKNQRNKVYQLFADGRLSFYTAADYSARSELMQYIKTIINDVESKERIRTEQKVLSINADLYKMISQMETFEEQFSGTISTKERKTIEREIAKMKKWLDGKVD